jgi:hypothetical protein
MKPLTTTELRQITGRCTAAEQLATLRQHGLNPFLCPKTDRPLVTAKVVNAAMLADNDSQFVGNLAAFD